MTLVESKLKKGTLTLGGTAEQPDLTLSCQAINVTLTPKSEQKGNPIETLCGDVATAQESSRWSLKFTGVQDWTVKEGFCNYAFDHDGTSTTFTFSPRGATGPVYSGTLTVMAVEIGGDVDARLTTDAEWPIATIERKDPDGTVTKLNETAPAKA